MRRHTGRLLWMWEWTFSFDKYWGVNNCYSVFAACGQNRRWIQEGSFGYKNTDSNTWLVLGEMWEYWECITHWDLWDKRLCGPKVWSCWCGEVINICFTISWMDPGFIINHCIAISIIIIECTLKCWMLPHVIHIYGQLGTKVVCHNSVSSRFGMY
jgi:hypothetical protein